MELDLEGVKPVSALERALVELPAKIAALESRAWTLMRDRDRGQQRLDEIETRILGLVASEVNEDGKPVYRNEEARRARAQESLKADGEHQALRRDSWEAEGAIAAAKRELALAGDLQRNARVLALSRAGHHGDGVV